MKSVLSIANRFFFLLILGCCAINVSGQFKCGTRRPTGPVLSVPTNYARQQSTDGKKMIRLFIHVTRPEYIVGTPAQDEYEILANLQYVQQYFDPYGICFIIQGFDEIINTDLDAIDPDDDNVLNQMAPYIRPGCLNIFVHGLIGGNVIGKSWDIPGTIVSLEGSYTWTGYPILAAHEIGHALGLFHTFEDFFGKEYVARSGNCSNCETAGDKICDTQADINADDAFFNNNCMYVGNHRDSCNNKYQIDPSNLMSYYAFTACVPSLHFTPGQGQRANYSIDNTPALQQLLVTAATLNGTANHTYTSGAVELVYRDNITINAPAYVASNTARLQMSSGEIVIKPGAQFTPGNGGLVVLRANTMCQ